MFFPIKESHASIQVQGQDGCIHSSFSLLHLSSRANHANLTPYLCLLPDCSGRYELADILKAPLQQEFRPDSLLSPSCKAYWIRLTINNPFPRAITDYYLRLNQDTHNELYRLPALKPVAINGTNIKIENSAIPFQPGYLPFDVPAKGIFSFYLKIEPPYVHVPLKVELIRKNSQQAKWEKEKNFNFFLMGILWVMGMYNLLLFFFVRDKSYLYYTFGIAGVFLWFFEEIILVNLWPSVSPDLVYQLFQPLWVIAFQLAYLYFTLSYFKIKTDFPRWYKYFRWLLIAYLIPTIFVLGTVLHLPLPCSTYWLLGLGAANVILVMVFNWYAFLKKYPPALYFMIANSPLIISALVMITEYLARNAFGHDWGFSGMMVFKYGVMADIVLFSIALAWRFNLLKRSIEENALKHAQLEKERLVEIQQLTAQKNMELEARVEERTQALQQINQQLQAAFATVALQKQTLQQQAERLEQLNELKDRLFSIIGHDLRSPLAAVKLTLDALNQEHLRPDEFFVISGNLQRSVDALLLNLENLLHWSMDQLKGDSIPLKKNIDLHQIASHLWELFHAFAQSKQLRLMQQIPSGTFVYADEDQLQLILRNLLNNAIKFTQPGGEIAMSCETKENRLIVKVSDTGIGMSEEQKQMILKSNHHQRTLGTKGEKGWGLGLLLCKEILEQNGEQLGIESELKKGTTIWFSLPMGNPSFTS